MYGLMLVCSFETSCMMKLMALLAEPNFLETVSYVRKEAINKGSGILFKFPFSTEHFNFLPHLLNIFLLLGYYNHGCCIYWQ
jgi:hypothetical protein